MPAPLFSSPQLKIMYNEFYDVPCLQFDFTGKFMEQTAIDAVKIWTKEFDNTDSKFVHIWNCIEMSGFEIAAKKQWEEALREYHHQIARVYIISNSVIIRSAAKLMSKFMNYELIVLNSSRWRQVENAQIEK